MTARTGMANLLTKLRGMTEAGTADYAIAGTNYWSDDLLQSILDGHRTDLVDAPLKVATEYAAGVLEYHNYYASYADLEEATSGTAAWDVHDSIGASQGTANYTVNYDNGNIRFAADTAGTAYYLTARSFNMKAAAVDVWMRKAGHAASGYGFAADGATFHRQQVFEHCLRMAETYCADGVMKVSRFVRSDYAA